MTRAKTLGVAVASAALLALAGCGGGGGGGGGTSARGLRIQTPEIVIGPGQEITSCYYFRTPNTQTLAIKRWSSTMGAGARHMLVFRTTDLGGQPVDKMPPGTLSETSCGFTSSGTGIVPKWLYAAYTPSETLDMPADDGTGKPLAMEVPADTAGLLLMRFVNPGAGPITARVTLTADALDAGVAYTRTDTYLTIDPSIEILANTNGDVETQICNIPPDVGFWRMSTHTHKQGVETVVTDGTTVAFTGTDWEQPGAATFAAPDFFSFATNHLIQTCTYDNPTNRTIIGGDSWATDEQCVAVGHFFPATEPLLCFDGFGPF